MATFNPQNPYEVLMQQLQGGQQALVQGTQQRLQYEQQQLDQQAAEQRQMETQQGFNLQSWALQEQQRVDTILAEIGDEDENLARGLTAYRDELARGAMADPRQAAILLNNIRVTLPKAPAAPGEEDEEGEGPPLLGGPHVASERMSTETLTGPQLMARAQSLAGNIGRTREEEQRQADRDFEIDMTHLRDDLQTARQEAQNEWQWGLSLQNLSNQYLLQSAELLAKLPEEERQAHQGVVSALARIATADSPAQAVALWSQGEAFGGDVYSNLANLGGAVDTYTRKQDRIIKQFDQVVGALMEDSAVDPAHARRVLGDMETYVLAGGGDIISPEELNMVRAYVNSPRAVWTREDYKNRPELLATGISQYYDPSTGSIDVMSMREANPTLADVFTADEGFGREALRRLQHQQQLDQQALDNASSERVQKAALGDATIFKSLSPDEKAEVKRILGMPGVSDEFARDTIVQRNRRANDAAMAGWDRQVAEAESAQYAADTNMARDVATLVENGNTTGLRLFEASTGDTVDEEAWAHANRVHDAKMRQLEADTIYREATASEALRKAQQGQALNDLEVEALRQKYLFDSASLANDLNMLAFRTDTEAIGTLGQVAQVVGPEFWDEENLPPSLKRLVSSMGLSGQLRAVSTAAEFLRGQPQRLEAYELVTNLARTIPGDPAQASQAAHEALTNAGVKPGVADAYVNFLGGSWSLLQAGEARAWNQDRRAEEQLGLQYRQDARAEEQLELQQRADQRATTQLGLDIQGNQRAWNADARAEAAEARAAEKWQLELAERNAQLALLEEGVVDLDTAKELVNLNNTSLDNLRQAQDQEGRNLALQGCAVEPSVFGGERQYRPDATSNVTGLPCGPAIEQHLENQRIINETAAAQLEYTTSLATANGWDMTPQIRRLEGLTSDRNLGAVSDPSRVQYNNTVVAGMNNDQVLAAARSLATSNDQSRLDEFRLLYGRLVQEVGEEGAEALITGAAQPDW